MKYDDTDIPARYDESRRLPDETIALWIDTISEHIPFKKINSIIDLGCGTGRFLRALIDKSNAIIYGIDPSTKMINKAREAIASPNLSFMQSNAEDLCIESNSVDLIFASQIYHHFHNKSKSIPEIKRVLKTKGFLCIRNSTVENLKTCFYLQFFPKAFKDNHKLLSSRAEILGLLKQHQFKIITVRAINYKVSKNLVECIEKVKLRTYTDLVQLRDTEFQQGLNAFELYCKKHDTSKPIFEEMDLFICKKL